MIKVQLTGGTTCEGQLFAVDPVTRSLALKSADGSFVVIHPQHILSINGDLRSCPHPNPAELGMSATDVEKKEQISRSNTDKAMKALNSNVDSVIQALYDKLSTIFPCSWKGNTIVVLNEFIIEPPYVEVKGTGAAAGIERISKILEGERKKLNM